MPTNPNEIDAAILQAESGDFGSLGTILSGLEDDDPELRMKAAYACKRIGFHSAIDPLANMASSDYESENRIQAIYALGACGTPAVVPPLIAALSDGDQNCREAARTALFQVLGPKVRSQFSDEEEGGPDPSESTRLSEWWQKNEARLDPGFAYTKGALASPGAFIRELKATKTALPDAIYAALHDWTGQDFGKTPKPKVIAKWDKWWSENRSRFQPGHRYFHGHLIP